MKFEEVAPPLVPPIARFISKKKGWSKGNVSLRAIS